MRPSASLAVPATAPAAAGVQASSSADPMTAPGQVLTSEQTAQWKSRIHAALEGTKTAITQGKTNVARYKGEYLSRLPTQDEVLVPTDFYYVEAKKAQLFYRRPDVFVKPEQPGTEDAAVVFQAALNKLLGPQGVNVLPTVQQAIFDVLCPTGFGALAIGYQTVTNGMTQVQVGMEPDPTAPPVPPAAGGILGLSAPTPAMRPVMQPAPNIVARWYFIEHVRPGDLLVPPEFVGMDFDKAAWLGQRFREDVPDDNTQGSTATDDDRRLTPLPSGAQAAQRKQRTGYEIWYRAHLFDPDVFHPDKIRMFKLYDDDREDVTVRDHPHQRYKNAAGELLAGMRGYPIAPVTLRYVSDTWMAPSDCTMARNTADELSKGRTQMIQARDRNLPQVGYDSTRVDRDVLAKIERNEVGAWVGFNGGSQDATWPIQKGTPARETYQFNEIAQGDLGRIWRMGDNQLAQFSDTSRTATEQQITASASQSAHEADRSVILDWYVQKVVAKFAALLQLYADQDQFVELVGADAQRLKSIPPQVQQQAQQAGQDARVLVPWNKDAIQGLYTFSAKPNSQLFVDVAQENKQLMDLYNFFANSPNINRAELERAILSRYGFDPSKMMQAPPPKGPEPPKVAFSCTGADVSPINPQSPIVLDILNKMGVQVDGAAIQAGMQLAARLPPAVTPAQPQPGQGGPQSGHGGTPAPAQLVNKHHEALTGGMQNTGQPAPLGTPGVH